MSRRNKGMDMVARVEETRERKAALKMAQHRRSLRAQEQYLADLMRYHGDYAQSLLDALARGVDSAKLSHYRNFIARLEEAIARQERQVESSRRAHDQSHSEWLQRRRRADAIDHVLERGRALKSSEAHKQEQRESDAEGVRHWVMKGK